MNVKKEVYDKCKSMVEKEISSARFNLMQNRRKINELAKEQRILKSEIGQLYQTLKSFK